MKLKKLIILSVLSIISGCNSNVPVTFYGQSFGDYMEGKNSPFEFYPGLSYSPELVQRKWKLRSIGGESAPYGIPLEDLDLWLNLTPEVGKTGFKYSGHYSKKSFSGEYEFDENGNISILSMEVIGGAIIKGRKGKTISKFIGSVGNALTFKLSVSGLGMRVYSVETFLEFYAID